MKQKISILLALLICFATNAWALEFTAVNEDGVPIYYNTIADGVEVAHGNWYYSGDIKIPASVTSIGYDAFYNYSELISLKLPPFLTSIGDSAFNKCTGLKYIIFPKSVNFVGDSAFKSCYNLSEVTAYSTNLTIRQYAFSYCTSLSTFTIYAATPPVIPTYSSPFGNTPTSDCVLYVPAQSIDSYKAADGWKDFTNIQTIPEVGIVGDYDTYHFSTAITTESLSGLVVNVDDVALTAAQLKEGDAVWSYSCPGIVECSINEADDAKTQFQVQILRAGTTEATLTFKDKSYTCTFQVHEANLAIGIDKCVLTPNRPTEVPYTFTVDGEAKEPTNISVLPFDDSSFLFATATPIDTEYLSLSAETPAELPWTSTKSTITAQLQYNTHRTFNRVFSNTIEGVKFIVLETMPPLTLRLPHGRIEIPNAEGKTLIIEPIAGYKFLSATLDGEDVTALVGADGNFTVPANLGENPELIILFEETNANAPTEAVPD